MSVSHHNTGRMQQKQLPFDKTMPASGTHSLEPSLRGRGLRFSGSCSKVARTQSAIAFGSAVILLGDKSMQAWCGGGSGSSEVPGTNDIGCRKRTFTRSQSLLPLCRTHSAPVIRHNHPRTRSFFSSPQCKRSVSHVHAPAAFRRIRGTAHGCTSP
jgi:hypothetical protein